MWWSKLVTWFVKPPLSDEEFARERQRLIAKTPVPMIWLFGKTGSGKSSIVRYLTGATAAEIGNGFRPQTKTAALYEFPNDEQPVIRFLDTRGLGEAHYDPAADLAEHGSTSHVILVTARVMDQALEPILAPLRQLREAHSTRPVVLALTCLHEAYPGMQHPEPDPFTEDGVAATALPGELSRAMTAQRERFKGLIDQVVPLDLTPPEEGFTEPRFGGTRLEGAIQRALPAAYRQALIVLHEVRENLRDLSERQAWPIILTHASLAATAAAAPVPWADIPAVLAVQSRMVYRLAELYGQPMRAELLWKLGAALGGQIVARMALRAPLKLIPVVGLTANAALAFVYTLSLGKACCWYFGEIRHGHVPSESELQAQLSGQFDRAWAAWQQRKDVSR